MPTRVLVPSGVLGLGFDVAALERGIAADPDIICIDGGSTDSGPYYLGRGHRNTPVMFARLNGAI